MPIPGEHEEAGLSAGETPSIDEDRPWQAGAESTPVDVSELEPDRSVDDLIDEKDELADEVESLLRRLADRDDEIAAAKRLVDSLKARLHEEVELLAAARTEAATAVEQAETAQRYAVEQHRILIALLAAAGGDLTITENALVADPKGTLVVEETMIEGAGAKRYRLTCTDGHAPDDPAPGRDVVCRRCGLLVTAADDRPPTAVPT